MQKNKKGTRTEKMEQTGNDEGPSSHAGEGGAERPADGLPPPPPSVPAPPPPPAHQSVSFGAPSPSTIGGGKAGVGVGFGGVGVGVGVGAGVGFSGVTGMAGISGATYL